MNVTITNFKKNNKTSEYNSNLRRIMANNLDSVKEEGWNEELAYFIYADVEPQKIQNIKYEINNSQDNSEDLKNYEINFYTKKEIDRQIESLLEGKDSVPYDKIKLYRDCDNGKISEIIKYKDKGLLTSISALSLKTLYENYGYEGLFE